VPEPSLNGLFPSRSRLSLSPGSAFRNAGGASRLSSGFPQNRSQSAGGRQLLTSAGVLGRNCFWFGSGTGKMIFSAPVIEKNRETVVTAHSDPAG
jgi:hypothetical protein